MQVEQLQNELEKAQKEVKQLQSDMQIGQDKIRYYYKDIEENLEKVSTEKAKEKLKQSDIVKNYGGLIDKYNGVVQKFNDQLVEKKELKQQVHDLTYQNQSYQRENHELKEKLLQIGKEFSAFKSRVTKVLSSQLSRVKTFLRINDGDSKFIKFLDQNQEKFIQDSLKKMEEPQKQKRMEMER